MGAKSSESCLIEMQCLREASEACSILKLNLQVFVFLTLQLKVNPINFMS